MQQCMKFNVILCYVEKDMHKLTIYFLFIIACKAGWYGKNCSDECSQSCNGTCDPTDGSCNNCEGSKSYCSKGNYRWHLKDIFVYLLIHKNVMVWFILLITVLVI